MSLSHIIILGIIILIVVPPEKLPEIMRNIGRFIGDLKRQTNGVFSEITSDIKKDVKLTPEDMFKKITENHLETQKQASSVTPIVKVNSEDTSGQNGH